MKKTEQQKWENKLSSREKWNHWKGTIVTTFSIILGTFTNILFLIYPESYVGWILLSAVIIVCAVAIIIDTIWDNKNKELKTEYDLKYGWQLNPELPSNIQTNLSNCLASYKFCKNTTDLEEIIHTYYDNIRNTLNYCCDVFSSIFSETNEEKPTFSIRYMFKSKIDNKMTLLWGRNSAPENISKRIFDNDCYEKTGAADIISKNTKQPIPIPRTDELDKDDPYYEDEKSSKLLIPVQSTSDMVIGVIVIKKRLTSDDSIFYSAERKPFSWQFALKQFTEVIAMIEKQFSMDKNNATKGQLKQAYGNFIKNNSIFENVPDCKDSIII